MVAKFNQFFIIIFLCSPNLYATEIDLVTDDDVISLAQSKFMRAKERAEGAIDRCEALAKDNVLSPSLFNKISIEPRQLEIALHVLNLKARNTCDGDFMARFFVAASIYRATAEKFNRVAEETLPYTEYMLYGTSWMSLKTNVSYNSIEQQVRDSLESITELSKPFNLFKTLKLLKLPE